MIVQWLDARLRGTMPGRVLHYLMFTDGFNGPRVSEDMLEPWGISHLKIAFAPNLFGEGNPASGWIDEDIAKAYLADAEALPRRAILCIDIESPEWNTAVKQQGKYTPQPAAIDLRIRLLQFVHRERPDLDVGYFSQVPCRHYDAMIQGQAGPDVFEALTPIAELADVLFPEFYFVSHLARPLLVEWINRSLSNAAEYYPRREVCPFVWPHYYDQWLEHPELRNTAIHERACRMRPDIWQTVLDTVHDHTASWTLWAGDGYPPWDDAAPWWFATREALSTRGIPSFKAELLRHLPGGMDASK